MKAVKVVLCSFLAIGVLSITACGGSTEVSTPSELTSLNTKQEMASAVNLLPSRSAVNPTTFANSKFQMVGLRQTISPTVDFNHDALFSLQFSSIEMTPIGSLEQALAGLMTIVVPGCASAAVFSVFTDKIPVAYSSHSLSVDAAAKVSDACKTTANNEAGQFLKTLQTSGHYTRVSAAGSFLYVEHSGGIIYIFKKL